MITVEFGCGESAQALIKAAGGVEVGVQVRQGRMYFTEDTRQSEGLLTLGQDSVVAVLGVDASEVEYSADCTGEMRVALEEMK